MFTRIGLGGPTMVFVRVPPTQTLVITGASVITTPNQTSVKLPVLLDAVSPLVVKMLA